MARQYHASLESPLSLKSVRENEKRAYQYEAVSEDGRMSKATAADQVRISLVR
jgi:hypothetical protein